MIVVCAYVGYKGLDDVSLYAKDGLGFDEVQSANISATLMWLRPVAAIAAGFLADRLSVTRLTIGSFLLLGISSGLIAAGVLRPGMTALFFLLLVGTGSALFALRVLYFAIMDEGRIPFALTGTAVGIVSVVGYTPDVFMAPWMGFLTDRFPGATGHHYVFATLAGFAAVGLVASFLYRHLSLAATSGDSESSPP